MTPNTSHVFNCCALVASGLVLFLAQCFSLAGGHDDDLSGPPSAMGLWPLATAALLVTTGCLGLVGYFAQSLVCALIYVVGVIVFQLEVVGAMTWTMASAKARQADYEALGCLITLGAMLFYTGLPTATKPERKLLRVLLAQ